MTKREELIINLMVEYEMSLERSLQQDIRIYREKLENLPISELENIWKGISSPPSRTAMT